MKKTVTEEYMKHIHGESYMHVVKYSDGQTICETVNKDPSLAREEFQEQSDINHILKGYTGHIPTVQFSEQILDLTDVPTYQEALDITINAQNAFSQLPAEIRKRFGNDPAEMLGFLQDPKNKSEAQKLGLINPDPVVEPTTNQILNEIKNDLKTQNKKTTTKLDAE